MRYIIKLEEMLEDMDKVEEKYAERTIRLSDMDEFEKKFLNLCDRINKELWVKCSLRSFLKKVNSILLKIFGKAVKI